MEAATCDEPLGILLGVVCGHGVKSSGEAGDIGRSRIDQHCTVQPDLVHVFQKGFGRAGELQDPIEIGLMLFHQLEGCGTQHELERLEMGIRFTQVATSGCACRLPKGPTCWGYLSEPYTHLTKISVVSCPYREALENSSRRASQKVSWGAGLSNGGRRSALAPSFWSMVFCWRLTLLLPFMNSAGYSWASFLIF